MKIIGVILWIFISTSAFSKELPVMNKTVNDYSGVLSQSDKDEMDRLIRDYKQQSTNQLGVLVIDSLEGDNMEEFVNRAFRKWGLGSAKQDNGVLIFLAVKDRKYRIEVGQGLEGDLTDAESKRITSEAKSLLRDKLYGKALILEIQLIIKTITKNQRPMAESTVYINTLPGKQDYLDLGLKKKETPGLFSSIASAVGAVMVHFVNIVFVKNLGLALVCLVTLVLVISLFGDVKTKKMVALINEKISQESELVSEYKKEGDKRQDLATESAMELQAIQIKYQVSDHQKEDILKDDYEMAQSNTKKLERKVSKLQLEAKRLGVKL